MKEAAVIGAGAWGTALAKVLADKGNRVRLWTRSEERAKTLARERQNERYLPGVRLPEGVTFTSSLEAALGRALLVALVVPSHGLREILEQAKAHMPAAAALVSSSKGIVNDTLMLMNEVFEDVLGPDVRRRLIVLSGPSFAK